MTEQPAILDIVALLADLPAAGLGRGQVGTVVVQLDDAAVLADRAAAVRHGPQRVLDVARVRRRPAGHGHGLGRAQADLRVVRDPHRVGDRRFDAPFARRLHL